LRMAGLEFETPINNETDTIDDPVADFIAREQLVLGNINDDLIPNSNDQTSPLNRQDDIKINGDLDGIESANLTNGINDLVNGVKNANINSDQSSIFLSSTVPVQEPESIKKWREEHLKALEAKDEEEREKIKEHKLQAKKELDEWYRNYQDQLEKAKKQNRSAEKEWIAERDNDQPGQAWEKINRMCDFNPKTSRNNRDTSRMRSMLLQLKQNPPASSSSATTS
ncbi:Clathrin light chain, partial [Sarcoptes scabiei]